MRYNEWVEFGVFATFAAGMSAMFGAWQESVSAAVFMFGAFMWIGRGL